MAQIINDLGEETIAAGDNVRFEYEFFNEDGTPTDLTGGSFSNYQGYFILSEIGNESINVFSKEMSLKIGTLNTLTCDLSSTDTIDLPRHSLSVKIVIKSGDEFYKKARGIITILDDTNEV